MDDDKIHFWATQEPEPPRTTPALLWRARCQSVFRQMEQDQGFDRACDIIAQALGTEFARELQQQENSNEKTRDRIA